MLDLALHAHYRHERFHQRVRQDHQVVHLLSGGRRSFIPPRQPRLCCPPFICVSIPKHHRIAKQLLHATRNMVTSDHQ